jgi:hypothetical protein
VQCSWQGRCCGFKALLRSPATAPSHPATLPTLPRVPTPCRRLLREEVTSGRLAAAESKAEVLGELVERVRFDAEAAAAFHTALYKQKLASLLEKKKLTEEDDKALREMQVGCRLAGRRRLW